jgi:hypothetical protein
MLLPTLGLAIGAAVVSLFLLFRRRRHTTTFWRTALLIGLGLGLTRAILASIGWYTVEHTGGPLQIPGFALSMLAWPEAVILPRRRIAPVPAEFYVLLSLLLVCGSVLLVTMVALSARLADRLR